MVLLVVAAVATTAALTDRGLAELDGSALHGEGGLAAMSSVAAMVRRNEPVVLRAAIPTAAMSVWQSDELLLAAVEDSCGKAQRRQKKNGPGFLEPRSPNTSP